MRRFIGAAVLTAGIFLGAPRGQAQELLPLSVGAQWSWDQMDVARCAAPNRGGLSCLRFPSGAAIHVIAWQSSLKVGGEILIHLVTGPDPTAALGLGLLSTHHASEEATHITKIVTLPRPIRIPAGHFVWVFITGGGAAHGAAVEVQFTLYVEPTDVIPIFP